MATKHDVYEALRDHFAKTKEAPDLNALAGSIGLHWPALKQHLLRLKKEGAVRWEDGDYSTMELGAKLPKPDKHSAPTPAAKGTQPRKKPTRAPKVSTTEVRAEVLATSGPTSLIGARAVIYDDGELAQLEAQADQLEASAGALRALVTAIRAQKPLDARSAMLIEIVAQVQA